MPQRRVRARFRHGNFEPVEPITLPEDSEVDLTVDMPEGKGPQGHPDVELASWDLGIKGPITRCEIYDDVG